MRLPISEKTFVAAISPSVAAVRLSTRASANERDQEQQQQQQQTDRRKMGMNTHTQHTSKERKLMRTACGASAPHLIDSMASDEDGSGSTDSEGQRASRPARVRDR